MTTAKVEAPPVAASVRFEMERNDWCQILADAATCAEDGFGYMPVLGCVNVAVTNEGMIVATGTDRFVLGRRTYHLPGPVGDAVSVMVPVTEIAAMNKIHERPRAGSKRQIQVTIVGPVERDGGSVTLLSGGNGARRVESVHPCLAVEAIKMDSILRRAPDGMSDFSVDPSKLARFAKVSRAIREHMKVTLTGPNQAVLIKIGEHFEGAIMPVRADA